MALEPKNIPLKGLFPLPDELADAPTRARAVFWKLIGTEALRLKRLEILSGIDRWGNKFKPVKRKWGDPTPLLPHGKASRTYRLLSLNASAQGATLYWKSEGGRETWPTILGYHAYKHGPRSLPVRDELGLTQKSVNQLMAQADIWKAGYEAGLDWASRHPKELKLGKPRIPPPERFPSSRAAYERELARRLGESPKVVLPVPKPKPKPKPRPQPRPAAEDLKLTKTEDKRRMAEADRLAKEADAEAKAIMDEARLAAIRAREEKKKPKPKSLKGEPVLTGKPILPRSSMGERLDRWTEGDKLVRSVFDVTREADDLAREHEENNKKITELMYAQATVKGEDLQRLREEMDRKIEDGKTLRAKLRLAKEKAFDAIVSRVNIPKDQRSVPVVDMHDYEDVSTPKGIEIAKKTIERLGSMLRNAPVKSEIQPLMGYERSHYSPSKKNLNFTPDLEAQFVAHEMAHVIEANHPEIFEATMKFLEHRVGNEPFTNMDTLPKGGALTGEKGRKDKFDQFYDDPNDVTSAYYAGKIYPGNQNNELFSMGIQALFTDPGKFAAKDPEWCKFILGILSGELRSK